ncbi:MAG: energy transducer TonB [Thermodesulfobacteriota bacterium]
MIALQSFPDTPSSEPRLVWGVLFSFILHLVLAFALMGIPEFSAPKRTYFSSAYRVKLVDAPVSRRGRISVSKAGGKQGGKDSSVKASTKKSKKTKSKKGITLSKKSSAKKGNVVRTTKRKPKKMDAGKAFSLAMSKIKGKVEERRRKEEIARIQEKIVEKEGEGEGEGDGLSAGSGGLPPGGVFANLPLNYRLYYQAIEQKIKSNWNLALPRGVIEDMRGMEVVLSITIRSDGEIIKTSFEEKSGNVYLDDSAFRAVKKSNPLPSFSEYNIRESSFETGIIFPAGELL